jgi:hypothetical protein
MLSAAATCCTQHWCGSVPPSTFDRIRLLTESAAAAEAGNSDVSPASNYISSVDTRRPMYCRRATAPSRRTTELCSDHNALWPHTSGLRTATPACNADAVQLLTVSRHHMLLAIRNGHRRARRGSSGDGRVGSGEAITRSTAAGTPNAITVPLGLRSPAGLRAAPISWRRLPAGISRATRTPAELETGVE